MTTDINATINITTYLPRCLDFLQTVLAMLIILPIIHHLLTGWLEGFAYHIQIHWAVYPLAALTMTFMILCTISFRTLKAAQANPTELLRND